VTALRIIAQLCDKAGKHDQISWAACQGSKQTLAGADSVNPTHLTALQALADHSRPVLVPLLERVEAQLRTVTDGLSQE